jgi:outer membrane protein TolC
MLGFPIRFRDRPGSNSNAAGINGYGAFLNVEWDLFDGFERVERLRKKSAEEQAARENLVAAWLDASRDVWTTCHDTLSVARRVASAEAFVASEQEKFLGHRGLLAHRSESSW